MTGKVIHESEHGRTTVYPETKKQRANRIKQDAEKLDSKLEAQRERIDSALAQMAH